MSRTSRKIWSGLGAATLVTVTTSSPALAQHGGQHGATATPEAKESGALTSGGIVHPQSGESYLTDGGPRDTRIRIYRDIALMRGHILVGTELVEAGRWDDALPHFLHPTEELYGAMERYIKLHKVIPFDKQLKALAQAVKARNKAAFDQSAKLVDARLTNALTSFRRFMTVQPFSSYTMRTVVEVLKAAKGEYEQSIENGRFAKPVEYQDSRGFVWFADALLDGMQKELTKINAERFADLKRRINELKLAWPSAVPPEKPVKSAIDVAFQIDAFSSEASRFH